MRTPELLPNWSRNTVQRNLERGRGLRSIIWVYVAARKKRQRAMATVAPRAEIAGANVVPFRQTAAA